MKETKAPKWNHAPRKLRAICRRLMRESYNDLGSALKRREAQKWRETDPTTLELMGFDLRENPAPVLLPSIQNQEA